MRGFRIIDKLPVVILDEDIYIYIYIHTRNYV